MPVYTLTRTAKLSTPTGIGEGRVVEGIINRNWPDSAVAITAGSLGLRTITNLVLNSGTSIQITSYARVVNPGSFGNTVRVRTSMRQDGYARIGTIKYTTFSPVFSATPTVVLGIGSPTARTIGTYEPRIARLRPGSFGAVGSPTFANCPYIAVGAGSYPLNFVAMGH